MKTVYNKIIPFKGYKAIMLFGVIFARKEYEPLSEIDINHEKIHPEQARNCGGYLWFYLKYAYWYVKYGFSYRRNPFEREAYYFQSDLGYIERYREKRSWKNFIYKEREMNKMLSDIRIFLFCIILLLAGACGSKKTTLTSDTRTIENVSTQAKVVTHTDSAAFSHLSQTEQKNIDTEDYGQMFISSADAIRGIKPTDEQPQGALIKTNFNEFKEQLDKLFSTGEQCSVKDNFYRILHKADIFSNTELINLGNVKKMQIVQPDDDWLINNIKVGYAKQDYNYPLGRQEFAVTLEFDNQLNVDSKTLDLVSKYRADYTGVHLLHYDYANSDKKDSKSDNDIFWILAFNTETKNLLSGVTGEVVFIYITVGQIINTPTTLFRIQTGHHSYVNITNAGIDDEIVITEISVVKEQEVLPDTILLKYETASTSDKWRAIKGGRVTGISGLEGDGYFNILLSPKTMLINHARFFASLLDKHEKVLRYTSSTETMSALEYTDTQLGHVVEKADLSVANAVPFFKPFIFMFNCIVPVSLSEIMGETPCGYFKFEYNNLILKGFPVDVQGSYVDSEQTVKCIAHVDTPDNIQELLHKRLPNKLYK